MNRIIVHSQVGSDGVLQFALPMGASAAGQQVEVIIEPSARPAPTLEEWQRRIRETAGQWQGDFERPTQGEFEQREPLQ